MFDNTESGHRKLAQKLGARRRRARVVVEATGVYHLDLALALRPIYRRMIEAGKPPKVAFIALARKLLTMLNAMVRDGTQWEERTL